MRTAFPHFLNGAMIALLLLQLGCGAIELFSHGPNTKKEDWNDWQPCRDMPLSAKEKSPQIYCLEEDPNFKDANPKPPLLLLHELNGLTAQTFRYAMELSNDFTVYVPMLFGVKGEESVLRGLLRYWFGLEWGHPPDGSAPIVRWLRDVVSDIEQKHKSSPIRIIGNCMTGAFPLALLDNAHIDAVVVAQPALPMRFWWRPTDEDYSSLGLSSYDLGVAQKSKAKILALRFETDQVSPPAILKALQSRFEGRLSVAQICMRNYDPIDKQLRPHSTLIGEYDAAHEEVRKQSKNARETVRTFLLHPDSTSVRHSECP